MNNVAVPRNSSAQLHNFFEQNRLVGRGKPIVYCRSSELFTASVNISSM
jgi:hypothetical protein